MRAAGSVDDWARLAPMSNTATKAATHAAPMVSVNDIDLPPRISLPASGWARRCQRAERAVLLCRLRGVRLQLQGEFAQRPNAAGLGFRAPGLQALEVAFVLAGGLSGQRAQLLHELVYGAQLRTTFERRFQPLPCVRVGTQL